MMILLEKYILITVIFVLVVVCGVSFVTDHLLDMKVDIEIDTSYKLINLINLCKVVLDGCVICLISLGIIKFLLWLWGSVIT